jgi:hypothetical protein
MELDHLLTRSGLTCPEASSKVCHDSFCTPTLILTTGKSHGKKLDRFSLNDDMDTKKVSLFKYATNKDEK